MREVALGLAASRYKPVKRTAQAIEEKKAATLSEPTKKYGRGQHPNSKKAGRANMRPKPPWPKGVSANPGGLPGTDLAALYSRRFFEAHPEGISQELADDLKGLNAYAFGVLADRGYGKVKETQLVEHSGDLKITVKFEKPEEDK